MDSALEIAARIASADAAHLPQLDEWARGQLAPSWDAGPQWQDWGPLVKIHPELRLALACAPSGHVREQACGLLAAHPTSPGLGLLLLRSNDWVYFVRAEARAALAAYEHPGLAAWWTRHLPLVLRFGQAVRAPFPSLFGRVQALLASPEAAEALRAGWRSPDVTVRRGLLQMFGPLGIDAEILTLLTGDPDVRIRRTLVPLASPETLRTLLRDPDVRVRALALTRLLPTLATEPETPEIQHALLDTHSSVRWQVQYALRQAGHDVRQLYLGMADLPLTPRKQLGFLGGLADVGQAEDTDRVTPYLGPARSPRLQAEALRTLAALDAGQAQPLLWAALSGAGQVVRQAGRSLKQRDLITEPLLRASWDQATSSAHRQRLLPLVSQLSRFEAVALLLEWRSTAPDLVERIDDLLERRLAGFGETYFTRPGAALRERIRAAASLNLSPQLAGLIALL